MQIETVKTADFEMKFFRFGSGVRPFVILPGLSVQSVMGAADAIAEAYGCFAGEYTVYVFDRREQLPPVYPVAEMARDTAQAFLALGLRGADVFGASQGGMIAMEIAIMCPELVRSLALGSTAPRFRADQSSALEQWIHLARDGDAAALYLGFGEKLYPKELFEASRGALLAAAESVTENDLARFAVLAEGTRGFDVTEQLTAIRCPVLAVGDREDAVVGPEGTLAIAEKLGGRPDFRLHMYSGYGHAAYDTAPDYKDRLYRFFTGQYDRP